MKILLLGGNGFIGTNLCLRLAKDHSLVVIDRSEPKVELPQVEYAKSDISNLALVDYHLRHSDLVIYLTTAFVPANSNQQPKETLADTKYLVDILELLRHHNETKLIYFSTGGAIYGNVEEESISEESLKNPISGYGVCKLANESYINLYARLFDIQAVVLRPSNPYGPYQRTDGKQGVIARFSHLALKDENIQLVNGGKDVRDFIYIDDLVNCVCNIINNFKTGTYNIGSGVGNSILDLIYIIEEHLEIDIDKEFLDSRKFDVNRIVLNSDRVKSIFGWQPNISIKEGIKLFINWQQQNMRRSA